MFKGERMDRPDAERFYPRTNTSIFLLKGTVDH